MVKSNMYLKDAKDELKRKLEQATTKLALWESVKVITKKDGKPFKNVSKNFEGCYFYVESYNVAPYEKKCSVYGRDTRGYSVSDEILCYGSLEKNETEPKGSTRFQRGYGLKDGYLLGVDGICKKIEERKQNLKEHINNYVHALNNFDRVEQDIDKIETILKDANSINTEFYYIEKELVKHLYR